MESVFDDTREAATLVAEESPEGAGLLAALMAHNAEGLANVQDQIIAGLEAEVERYKQRAHEAEARLARIEYRLLSVLD